MRILFIISLIALSGLSLSAQDGKKARRDIREGNRAYREQLYGTAEGKYGEAAAADPTSSIASYNLANTYYKQQKWDEALKEYQRYLTLENQDQKRMSEAWSNIGNTYLKKKANEKAANLAAQQAGQAAGQMPGAQGQQGGQQQGQQQQADNLKMSMDAYKNSLRLNPADDDTRYNLAVVQKMIQDQKKDGGGGQDNKQDQDKKQDDKQDQQQQNQNQDQKQNKQDQQQNQNQMSQDNAQQILQALEQEEKQTQERVKETKAMERKKQNQDNRRNDKDW